MLSSQTGLDRHQKFWWNLCWRGWLTKGLNWLQAVLAELVRGNWHAEWVSAAVHPQTVNQDTSNIAVKNKGQKNLWYHQTRLSGLRWCYLLCITNHIKRLISNGYPNHVCFNKGIPIKLTYHNILCKIRYPTRHQKVKHTANCWITVFLSIRIVTMHKSHAPKVHITISRLEFRWSKGYCY